MVIPIVVVAIVALIGVPYLMTRDILDNELFIIVAGIVALAYVLKVAR